MIYIYIYTPGITVSTWYFYIFLWYICSAFTRKMGQMELKIPVSAFRRFLSHGDDPNPSHGWPWLIIESHGYLGMSHSKKPPPVIPIYTRYDRFMIFLLQDVEKSSATSIFLGAHNPIHVGRFRNHRWVRDVSSSSCKQTCSWTGVFPAWLVQCSWYKLDVGDYIPWSPMTHLTHGSDNPQLIQEQK